MRNRIHNIKKFILKALITIGVILIVGTMGSVEIYTMSFGEMFRYWIVSIVMIGVSYLLLRRCENA